MWGGGGKAIVTASSVKAACLRLWTLRDLLKYYIIIIIIYYYRLLYLEVGCIQGKQKELHP